MPAGVAGKIEGGLLALQDFTLLAKLEDFDLEAHKALQKFNKSERHVLSASIRNNFENIIFYVIRASKRQLSERRGGKRPVETLALLKEADTRLEYLKIQMRKAFRLNQLDPKAYECMAGMAKECGGILGSWIKKTDGQCGNSNNLRGQNSLI